MACKVSEGARNGFLSISNDTQLTPLAAKAEGSVLKGYHLLSHLQDGAMDSPTQNIGSSGSQMLAQPHWHQKQRHWVAEGQTVLDSPSTGVWVS